MFVLSYEPLITVLERWFHEDLHKLLESNSCLALQLTVATLFALFSLRSLAILIIQSPESRKLTMEKFQFEEMYISVFTLNIFFMINFSFDDILCERKKRIDYVLFTRVIFKEENEISFFVLAYLWI